MIKYCPRPSSACARDGSHQGHGARRPLSCECAWAGRPAGEHRKGRPAYEHRAGRGCLPATRGVCASTRCRAHPVPSLAPRPCAGAKAGTAAAWGVRALPTFLLFRHAVLFAEYAGANEDRLRELVTEHGVTLLNPVGGKPALQLHHQQVQLQQVQLPQQQQDRRRRLLRKQHAATRKRPVPRALPPPPPCRHAFTLAGDVPPSSGWHPLSMVDVRTVDPPRSACVSRPRPRPRVCPRARRSASETAAGQVLPRAVWSLSALVGPSRRSRSTAGGGGGARPLAHDALSVRAQPRRAPLL